MSDVDDLMPDDASAPDRRMLKIGVPMVLAVAALGSAPFLLGGGGDDTITTADVAATTTTISTTTTEPDVVFSTVDTEPAQIVETAVAEPATTLATTTTIPPTTIPPTTIPPTTVATTLPEQTTAPIAPPADPRGFENQNQLGGISIPKLGVDAPLLEGIRLTTLDNGPGHWPGTAMPGQVGNVVVAAHRTSHGGPFRHIDQLVAGDVVMFNTSVGETEYRVTSTQIVEPDALWIVDPTDTATATLFACHPPGSVAQRIVVKLELAS